MFYKTNILDECAENNNFRKVLFTGERSQLVAMDIPEGGDIGEETHDNVEQTFFIAVGKGEAIIDSEMVPVMEGDVVVVVPGTVHNFVNTGSGSLKIYTIYAPPNHIDGRIHETKDEALADREDEDFGNEVV